MLYFEKSQPAPDCLVTEKAKKTGDYKCGHVLERIRADFKNKCYICESAKPQTINVEHFRPHKGNVELKFSWENLFWSCGHCNNLKLDDYGDILDCTDINSAIESKIEYEFNPFPCEKVKVKALIETNEVTSTVNLIQAVFNGNTKLKIMEAANLRDDLLTEIQDFQYYLTEYFKDTSDEEDKIRYHSRIKSHLHCASSFVSFKRWIVRRNTGLMEQFGKYLV